MRWDLIDKFEILKKGERSTAVKTFAGDEDFFRDHFPGHPIVPGPLFIEMIAQAGGVLFGLGFDFRREVILGKISEASFYGEVVPPATVTVEAVMDDEREEGAWISGVVRQDGRTVAEAKIMLVSVASLNENSKVVFNDHFLSHYKVYEVAKASEGTS